MSSLSLDEDEEGGALSLDDEPTSGTLGYVVRLSPDSPYAKMPASLLQGKVVKTSFKVINVTDFDANLPEINPGPAYREITIVEVEG